MNPLLSILEKRPIIFDGAMGTMIQAACDAECNAILNVTKPGIIESIHDAYFEAGADVVTTNTFGASSIALADYNLGEKAAEINRAAVKIARRSAEKFSRSGRQVFVAGEIGPTTKLPTLGHIKFSELADSYAQQISAMLKEGADCIQIATCQDILQMKAAASAARQAMSRLGCAVPLFVSVTIEKNGAMLLGSDVIAALATIEPFSPDSFGINCATGPDMMEEHIHQLSRQSPFPIICRPNAGIPENVGGRPAYPLSPADFAGKLGAFSRELNVAILGGCCGTTPDHISVLAREVKGQRLKVKGAVYQPHVSSLFSAVSLDQEPKPFLVAEQTNVNGSKKFKELLLKEDYEGMASVAREAAKGAHALDICIAYPGRDELKDMAEVVSRVVKTVDSPVMIDSTNTSAIEAALSIAPGRCIINSINLEDGGAKAKEILKLAKRFGAAVVCLTIDEEGMAKNAKKKLEIAKRIRDLALLHGVRAEDLLFDALTFSVASGEATLADAALETIEGMKKIKKEIKGAKTILGVSNISYGLLPQARRVLTSLFLHRSVEAGLDCAIVNPLRILRLSQIPENEEGLARRLLENDRSNGPPLQNVLKYYERMFTEEKTIDETSFAHGQITTEDAIRQKIMNGDKSEITFLLDEISGEKKAGAIINDILLPSMKEVGALFGKGKLPLPFVLQSAEVMRTAIDYLAPKLKEGDVPKKATIVLATVRGDVHDIGKNLVDIILSNNGFEVVNLGIRQPINAIMEAARAHNADAIGLSGLLVSSTEIMREDLETLKHQGVSIPVLVGGAALTKKFTESTLKTAYGADVYYCEDAFSGLKAMEQLAKK